MRTRSLGELLGVLERVNERPAERERVIELEMYRQRQCVSREYILLPRRQVSRRAVGSLN